MLRIAIGALCLAMLAGCDGCGTRAPQAKPTVPPADPEPPPTPPTPTVVTGVVRLAEGASLPAYTHEEMEREVLQHTKRGAWPEACTPPKQADYQPVSLGPDGGLVGVMVAASNFTGATPRPPKTHEVVIHDCRLRPSLVVAMKGDHLIIKNEVDFPFMPTFGKTSIARTLMPGQRFDHPLSQGGVTSVLCGITAPCGRADVVTVFHPVYAVTDDKGRFSIPDFPADQTVELNAWHPLFAEAKLEVRIGQGETKQVELVLTPRASAAASGPSPDQPAATAE